jgi:hypothetical protein
VARVSELQSKANLAVGQKGYLEQARLSFVVIDPASHLPHDDAQIGAATANLDNVHAAPPLRETLKKAENATVGETKTLIFLGLESAARNFSEFP